MAVLRGLRQIEHESAVLLPSTCLRPARCQMAGRCRFTRCRPLASRGSRMCGAFGDCAIRIQ